MIRYYLFGGLMTGIALVASIMLVMEIAAKATRARFTTNVFWLIVIWVLVYYLWGVMVKFTQEGL